MLRRFSTPRVSAVMLGFDAAYLAVDAFAWAQFDEPWLAAFFFALAAGLAWAARGRWRDDASTGIAAALAVGAVAWLVGIWPVLEELEFVFEGDLLFALGFLALAAVALAMAAAHASAARSVWNDRDEA